MNLQDLVKLLRARWLTVVVTTVVGLLIAVVVTLLTTPLYLASTELFVSTTAGASANDLYQGNRLSQDRVHSYVELLKGRTIARRTIDKLNLNMTVDELRKRVNATSKIDTVLINVDVRDPSPERARDIANTMSDEFVSMVKELETPTPGARPDARVVVEQSAATPDKPVVPKRELNVAVGLVVGIAVGLCLAVLRDRLDNTVKSQAALEEITGVGMVGTIPTDKERREYPAIAFDKENSPIAESLRKLRTNLQFLSVDNPPRVIVVTSSAPREGKSTTSINIALALAEADNNVVLVDGDMRKPSLDKYLGLVGSVGLSTVLSGSADLPDALQNSAYPNLTVLAAGRTTPNPSELLASLSARRVLDELRSQFDYVIVDSAPLLAVTDGAILASRADGVLILARFGQTKREQLTNAIDSLKDVGAKLIGAVFTMMPRRGGGYGYDYRYSDYGSDRYSEQYSDSYYDDAAVSPLSDQVVRGT